MKSLRFLFLFAASITALGQAPIQRTPWTTNATGLSVAQFAANLLASSRTGSGAVVLSNSPAILTPTLTFPTVLTGFDFPNSFRATFVPGATVAGLNAGSVAADPSTLANGDLWYNSVAGKIRMQRGGTTVDLENGTVTSIGSTFPAELTLTSGSPITTAGTITYIWTTQAANTVLAGPTSGSAATPAYRSLVSSDLPVQPAISGINITNQNWSDISKWQEFAWNNNGVAGGEPAYGITAISKTAADGSNFRDGSSTNLGYWEPFTTSTSNRVFGISGTAQFFASQNLHIMFQAGISNAANYQFWCGWSSDTGPNMVGKTNQTGDFIGFEYSPLLNDVNFMIVSRDNATTSRTSTGVAATGAPTRFTIIGNNDGNSWKLMINNTVINAAYATNIPRTNVALRFSWGGSNATNQIRIGRLFLLKGRATWPYP